MTPERNGAATAPPLIAEPRRGQSWAPSAAILLLAAVLLVAVLLVRAIPSGEPNYTIGISAATFLGFLTPFTVIAIRHQVRRERIKHIELFAESFRFDDTTQLPDPKPGFAASKTARKYDNATFEFVRAKYFADLDNGAEPSYAMRTVSDIPRFPMMLHADWMLLFCAVPYMVLAAFGVFLLLLPEVMLRPPEAFSWLPPLVIGLGANNGLSLEAMQAQHENTLTVAAIAFGGAYFFTLRMFLRAVAVFDLSPLTFLRAFAHMVLSIVVVVILYRAIPDLSQITCALAEIGAAQCAPDPTPDGVGNTWLIAAFAFGFMPESALQFLLRKAPLMFKDRFNKADRVTKSIPLTLLDGVDFYISYRLEEANIFDVQNLATYNPIMLHIESPFGIYQTIDWVAQAQLCTIVGAERFLLLKSVNIRTIFDLQQAVFYSRADAAIVTMIGRILTTDTRRDAEMRETLFTPAHQASPAAQITLSTEAVRHLAEVLVDDLHVHRLRQLWKTILGRLDVPVCRGAAPAGQIEPLLQEDPPRPALAS